MLTLEAIEFRADTFALSADWSVTAQQRIAIVGPSGAGKSTLLDVIAGFRAQQSGRVIWDSRDMTKMAPQDRPVAMLFQDNNLFPHLTVAQNLALALRPSGRLSDAEKGKVETALARVDLSGLSDRKPAQISGGQQSRAALARVLLQARPLILLDEPFAALGPALKAEMLDLVAEVAQETNATTLLVTHDPNDALRFAEQTVVVADGIAHAPGQTQSLLNDADSPLRDYLGQSWTQQT